MQIKLKTYLLIKQKQKAGKAAKSSYTGEHRGEHGGPRGTWKENKINTKSKKKKKTEENSWGKDQTVQIKKCSWTA